MKRMIYAALVGVALVSQAKAGTVVDVATLKCSDFEKMDADTAGIFLSWIDGYLGGRAEDTRFDLDRFKKDADAAQAACKKDADQAVLSVMKDAEK